MQFWSLRLGGVGRAGMGATMRWVKRLVGGGVKAAGGGCWHLRWWADEDTRFGGKIGRCEYGLPQSAGWRLLRESFRTEEEAALRRDEIYGDGKDWGGALEVVRCSGQWCGCERWHWRYMTFGRRDE